MKKIYLILTIAILLVGSITALTFAISDTDFKTKITIISSDLFYSKLVDLNKLDLKEIPKDTTLSLDNSGLEITQNKDGVIRVKAK